MSRGPLENIQHLYLYHKVTYKGLFIWKYGGGWGLCDYDNTMIDDSSAQGGGKENWGVGEVGSNMYKNVVVETGLMASQVENDLHENLEL